MKNTIDLIEIQNNYSDTMIQGSIAQNVSTIHNHFKELKNPRTYKTKRLELEDFIDCRESILLKDLKDLNKHTFINEKVGIWFTTNEKDELVRICTSKNICDDLTKFKQFKNEIKMVVLSSYSDEQEGIIKMKSIKQSIKRLCAFNYKNGHGYKLLEFDLDFTE